MPPATRRHEKSGATMASQDDGFLADVVMRNKDFVRN
jgi:hypothetical protein